MGGGSAYPSKTLNLVYSGRPAGLNPRCQSLAKTLPFLLYFSELCTERFTKLLERFAIERQRYPFYCCVRNVTKLLVR